MTWPKAMMALYWLVTGLAVLSLVIHPWWLFALVTALVALWGGPVSMNAEGLELACSVGRHAA